MASLKKEITGTGRVRWVARYRAHGKQFEKSFPKKTDAEHWIATEMGAVASGTFSDPARGRVTVGQMGEQWFDAQTHLKATTRQGYESNLRIHVLPRWGETRVSEVTHGAVSSWFAGLTAQGLAASTVRHIHVVLNGILEFAISDNRIRVNPAARVRLPPKPPTTQHFLTRNQVIDLADAAGQDRDLMLLLAFCGLRFGEVVALRVADYDADKARLHINGSTSQVKGKAHRSPTPKGGKPRSVPVPAFLAYDLRDRTETRPNSAPLFVDEDGQQLLLPRWRRRVFDPACKEVGTTHITPHDLRHTAASLAVQVGAHVKVVQNMLGHASAAMTLDVYAGLFGDDLDDLAMRLDEAYRRSVEESRQTPPEEEPEAAPDEGSEPS